jgi:lipopolysaccharide/colanic/teichoic acid biosynthesis glycosyltransferase
MNTALTGEKWLASGQKRSMDITLSTALLPVAIPLSITAMAAIRIGDRYDPLFSHQRYGLGEELFTLHKLRTMSPNEQSDIASSGGSSDPRATRIGSFLRKVRLDEVPQLINIYRGEMAVVGPRPLVPSQYEEIMDSLSPRDQELWQRARSRTKPGMIDQFGISSYQNGYSNTSVAERVEADIAYYNDASLRTDTKLIFDSLSLISQILRPSAVDSKDSIHTYERGAKLLSSSAEAFGVKVTSEEFSRWDSLFKIVRVLDNLVDESGVKDLSEVLDACFNGQGHTLIDHNLSNQFFHSMNQLSLDERNKVRESLCQIPFFAEQKKRATSVKELASISRQEALAFASILHVRVDNGSSTERLSFNRWLNQVAQAGELMDASFDLRSDYDASMVSVRPSIANKLQLALLSAEHAGSVIKQQDFRRNLELARAAFACFRDR